MDTQDDSPDNGSQGGGARGYSWPPFEPGHEVSTLHGANSERHVGPLARQIAAALLAHPETPQYLREPSYSATVRAWARAEAVVELLWRWLEASDWDAALTDLTTTEEDAVFGKGRSSKRTASRRVESVLTQLHRAEVRAMNLRSRLGLDPLSRARLGKDVAAQRVDLARLFAEMQAPGEEDER